MSKFEEAMGKWFDAVLRKKMIEKETDNPKKKIIKYCDIKDEVLKKIQNLNINFGEPVDVVQGFLSPQFSTELHNTPMVGGPSIPMITLVGDSGRLYFVAFKKLFPELDM